MYRFLMKYIVYVQVPKQLYVHVKVPKQVYCTCTGPHKWIYRYQKIRKRDIKSEMKEWNDRCMIAWIICLWMWKKVKNPNAKLYFYFQILLQVNVAVVYYYVIIENDQIWVWKKRSSHSLLIRKRLKWHRYESYMNL